MYSQAFPLFLYSTWVTCHLSHMLGLSFKWKCSMQALTPSLCGCSLGLGALLCFLRRFPSCLSTQYFRHLRQTPSGSSERPCMPNKFSITAFCSNHLPLTPTPPLYSTLHVPLSPGPSPAEHRQGQVPIRKPSSEVVGKTSAPVTHW